MSCWPTRSKEPTAFSEETGATSEGGGRKPLENYLEAPDRRDHAGPGRVLRRMGCTHRADRHGEEHLDSSEEYPYALSQISGCPMVVMPAGVDDQGLPPFGLQIIGRRWCDERLLGIAELLAGSAVGFRRPPGY